MSSKKNNSEKPRIGRIEKLRNLIAGNYPSFIFGFLLALASLVAVLAYRYQKEGLVFVANQGILGERAGSISASNTSRALQPTISTAISASPLSGASVTPSARSPIPNNSQLKFPLNLNSADAYQLEALPEVGPVLAGRIVEYRRSRGPFKTVEDLDQVKGIGEKILSRIRPLVTVGN